MGRKKKQRRPEKSSRAIRAAVPPAPIIAAPRQKVRLVVWLVKRAWAVLGAVALLVGFLVDAGGVRTWVENRYLPSVDIAWYSHSEDGRLTLVDGPTYDVDDEAFLTNRVPVPINLAIRNREKRPLEVVRVELRYDGDLRVESSGTAKIDPANRLLIYEHAVGTLESVDDFTPLQTIDTVYVPLRLTTVPVIALSSEGVPMLSVTLLGYEGQRYADKTVRFAFTVFCKDRPPLRGVIDLTLRRIVEIAYPEDGCERTDVDVREEDLTLLSELLLGHDEVLEQWEEPESEHGPVMEYKKLAYRGGVYQLIVVDGQARRVLADSDGDEGMDYELVDLTQDGLPDRKSLFAPPALMVDWPARAWTLPED